MQTVTTTIQLRTFKALRLCYSCVHAEDIGTAPLHFASSLLLTPLISLQVSIPNSQFLDESCTFSKFLSVDDSLAHVSEVKVVRCQPLVGLLPKVGELPEAVPHVDLLSSVVHNTKEGNYASKILFLSPGPSTLRHHKHVCDLQLTEVLLNIATLL